MAKVVAMLLFAVATHIAERSLGRSNPMGYESSKQSFDFSKRAQNTCKPHLISLSRNKPENGFRTPPDCSL
jgi:hypothetical protein